MRSGAILACLLLLGAPATSEAQDCTTGGERGDPRPGLSGPEQLLESDDGRFLLHWTEEGVDAPTNQEDADDNGIPDFADLALLGLQAGDVAFPAAGYREVPPDDGQGGSDAIDVYFVDIEANGYAFSVPPMAGTDAQASCTVLLDGGLGNSLPGVFESVAAHEFHHCTQYAYTIQAASWLLESTATFEQYRLFDDPTLQSAVGVLWSIRLTRPDRALASTGSRYEYAGFVFELFWESFGGVDPARVPALWEALREAGGDQQTALDAESNRLWDQPFSRTFLDYVTWNAFACDRDDAMHYDYAEFPCDLDASVPIAQATDVVQLELSEIPYTAAYAYIPAAGSEDPVELRCDGPGEAGARARVRLLALDRFGREMEEQNSTGRDAEEFGLGLVGPQDPDGGTLVVLASTGNAPVSLRCDVQRQEVVLPPVDDDDDDDGGGCACTTAGPAPAGIGALLLLGLVPKRRRRRA
ncbi:MAG: hypothetical protein KDA24_20040 [Deltaproteobacteria bacterium]|nr:hypothetical protein [Deltaproteobacteria bacterium]